MQNKNWEKIKEAFNKEFALNKKWWKKGLDKTPFGTVVIEYNKDIKDFFKKQFQNQRQEFVDIVEKVNSKNIKSDRYFNAGSAIACEEILKELNK